MSRESFLSRPRKVIYADLPGLRDMAAQVELGPIEREEIASSGHEQTNRERSINLRLLTGIFGGGGSRTSSEQRGNSMSVRREGQVEAPTLARRVAEAMLSQRTCSLITNNREFGTLIDATLPVHFAGRLRVSLPVGMSWSACEAEFDQIQALRLEVSDLSSQEDSSWRHSTATLGMGYSKLVDATAIDSKFVLGRMSHVTMMLRGMSTKSAELELFAVAFSAGPGSVYIKPYFAAI